MARPQKNNLDYFSHDNNMRNDRKIKALRAKFGHVGYSVYNMILETLSENNLLLIEWVDAEIELISGDFGIHSEELISIINYACTIKLLKLSNNYLYCPQLDARSKAVYDKRTMDLDSLRIGNGVNLAETPVSFINKSKVKESKVKDIITIEKRTEIFENQVNSYSLEYHPDMLKKFTNYWTEKSKNGNELRFELEKTWDIKKRLEYWLSNENKFQGINNNGNGTKVNQQSVKSRLNYEFDPEKTKRRLEELTEQFPNLS